MKQITEKEFENYMEKKDEAIARVCLDDGRAPIYFYFSKEEVEECSLNKLKKCIIDFMREQNIPFEIVRVGIWLPIQAN